MSFQNLEYQKDKIIVCHNGINPTDFEKTKEHIKDIDFLYIATFEERKNHKRLIDALSLYAIKNTNVKCILIGADLGLLNSIRLYIHEKGLEKTLS